MTSRERQLRRRDARASSSAILTDIVRRERADAPSDARLSELTARVIATLGQAAPREEAIRGASPAIKSLVGVVAAATLAIAVVGVIRRQPLPTMDTAAAASIAAPPPAAAISTTSDAQPSAPLLSDRDSARASLNAPSARDSRAASHRRAEVASNIKPLARVAAPRAAAPKDEIDLLQSARQMLPDAPALALERVQEHERSHRLGAFVEEREALAIEALTRLQDRERAQRRARAFFERFPQSPYRQRVAQLLARDSTAGETPRRTH